MRKHRCVGQRVLTTEDAGKHPLLESPISGRFCCCFCLPFHQPSIRPNHDHDLLCEHPNRVGCESAQSILRQVLSLPWSRVRHLGASALTHQSRRQPLPAPRPSTCLPWLRCATIRVYVLFTRSCSRATKPNCRLLIAVARKMLHAIFGMFRWYTAYDGSRLFQRSTGESPAKAGRRK
jgi:hypothetical protein